MSRAEVEGGGGGIRGAARALFKRRADSRDESAPVAGEPAARRNGAADASAILADLCAWTAEIGDEGLLAEDLDPNAAIFDEGYVDSMSYVELLARIEERYSIAIPDEQVVGSTLSDLARYVAEVSAA